jgi:hypothetical protein
VILATAPGWLVWARSLNRLQIGLVALVASSSGLLAIQGGATPVQFFVSVCGGTVLGFGLVAYLRWIVPESGGWQ